MALKGLDIFKLTPKTNCKECGSPTCMAFAMKVAQGAVEISKCPHMSEEALATLSEATAPPMKTIKVGTGEAEYTLGGETVLYRHEKTFVSKTRYAAAISCCDENMDAKLEDLKKVDYERIGERMHVEMLYLTYCGSCDAAGYAAFVKKAMEAAPDKTIVLDCTNVDVAKAALDVCKDKKPILDGADASNYEAMSKLATEAGVVLGVRGADINELYDTTAAIEKLGNKNLVLNVGAASIKDAFATTVQIRRAALKDTNRTFGYPSIVNAAALAPGDSRMQAALASLFTVKYGSIVVMDGMSYAQALPLYGLRQNVFTDPQKPMKVEPGIYPLNDHRRLRADLLRSIRRAGALRRSLQPDHQRRRRTFRTDRMGGWKAFLHLCLQVHPGERRGQDQVQKAHHPRKGSRSEGRHRGEAAGLGGYRSSQRGSTAGEVLKGHAGKRRDLKAVG